MASRQVARLPAPVQGFSAAEVDAALELVPVAQEHAMHASHPDAAAALRWLEAIAVRLPREFAEELD